MKQTLSPSAAMAGAGAAVLARLYYGLTVESPGSPGGAWLSALLGMGLALPAVHWARPLGRQGGALIPLLLALTAVDAASVMEGTAFSESFLAFSHVAVPVLMLPLALAALRVTLLGGNAIGSAARVWMRALSVLMAVVVACQWPWYRPAWLMPLLGDGPAAVLRRGVQSAGWISMLAMGTMSLCEKPPRAGRVTVCLALSAGVAAVLIALRLMMAPQLAGAVLSRSARVDALLTNGRAPLNLQLPMIVIWFMAMLHLLCFEGFLTAALLNRCFPRLNWGLCCAVTVAGVYAMAAFGFRETTWLAAARFLTLLLAILAARMWRKGGARACEG